MKLLHINKGEKFILIKFRDFYKKKSISIKYATPYIYKKNGLAE